MNGMSGGEENNESRPFLRLHWTIGLAMEKLCGCSRATPSHPHVFVPSTKRPCRTETTLVALLNSWRLQNTARCSFGKWVPPSAYPHALRRDNTAFSN
jgi:hypothetical protein